MVSFGDCVDHELRARVDVAADEDRRLSRLERELVSNRIVAVVELDLCSIKQLAPIDSLADSKDDLVALDRACLGLVVERREAVGLRIDRARALLEDDARDMPCCIDEDLLRPQPHSTET